MRRSANASQDTASARSAPAASIPAGAMALLLAPFYLNDLANIFVAEAGPWLLQDYLCRLAVLGLAWFLARRHGLPAATPGLHLPLWPRLLLWTSVALVGGWLLLPGPGRILLTVLPETRLGGMPAIPPGWMRTMDLSAGLLLVSLSEEVIFRGVLQPRLAAFLRSEMLGILAGAVLFGLIHWSNGVGSVIQTTLFGIVMGWCVARSRSLHPVIIAHYVVDFLVFS